MSKIEKGEESMAFIGGEIDEWKEASKRPTRAQIGGQGGRRSRKK